MFQQITHAILHQGLTIQSMICTHESCHSMQTRGCYKTQPLTLFCQEQTARRLSSRYLLEYRALTHTQTHARTHPYASIPPSLSQTLTHARARPHTHIHTHTKPGRLRYIYMSQNTISPSLSLCELFFDKKLSRSCCDFKTKKRSIHTLKKQLTTLPLLSGCHGN